MSRAKGQFSQAYVDQHWPEQVALPASAVAGSANYATVHAYALQLNACPQKHAVRHADTDYLVFCFRSAEEAQSFKLEFKGERFNPNDRGRGDRRRHWNKPNGLAKEWVTARERATAARAMLGDLQRAREAADRWGLNIAAFYIDRAINDPAVATAIAEGDKADQSF